MDGAFGRLYRASMVVLAFAFVMPLESCRTSHATNSDCVVRVRIMRVPADNTDSMCRSRSGDLRSDDGDQIPDGVKILGCADTKDNTIIAPDNDRIMAHEIRHILDANCGNGETR